MHDGRALIYLGSHNEADQISPIIYKLGERGIIDVDVVLESGVCIEDYRIRAINQFDNVSVCDEPTTNSQLIDADRTIELVKEIGRKMPTDLPETLYHRIIGSSGQLSIPCEFSDNEYDVIAFDWSHAKSNRTIKFANMDNIKSIVLPHGDSPFINPLENIQAFHRLLEQECFFSKQKDLELIGFQSYEKMTNYDFLLFPNVQTARRAVNFAQNNQIKILGSPRYNPEWLDILDQISPKPPSTARSSLNIVIFSGRKQNNIATAELSRTLDLLGEFSDIRIMIKEHPREPLFTKSIKGNFSGELLIREDLETIQAVHWGDVFLDLGTSAIFGPLVRKKPVLSLEYAHANHTTSSHYFERSDLRSISDLYDSIHSLLQQGTECFYNDPEYEQFIDNMIIPNRPPCDDSVLTRWAKFIEIQSS